jgi:predicted nucleic acid-binding protein
MILVDSSIFIALADKRDQWHRSAVKLTDQLESEEIIVSDLIVSEVVTEIGQRAGGKAAMRMYHYFIDNCSLEYCDPASLPVAINEFLTYNGKLSFPDAFSVYLMKKMGIARIYSFDSDFDRVPGIQRVS